MASVLFTASAQESLAGIFAYLTGPLSNPQAAKTLAAKIDRTIALLEEQPELFPLCAAPRLHRMNCWKAPLGSSYLLLYRIEGPHVLVLRFCHSRQAYWHLL